MQRLITAQRDQVARGRLHADVMRLPRADTRREAWLACDAFSSQWIGSWPSERDAISPQEFPEVLATYTETLAPLLTGVVIRDRLLRTPQGGR